MQGRVFQWRKKTNYKLYSFLDYHKNVVSTRINNEALSRVVAWIFPPTEELNSTFGYADLNYISYHSPRRLKWDNFHKSLVLTCAGHQSMAGWFILSDYSSYWESSFKASVIQFYDLRRKCSEQVFQCTKIIKNVINFSWIIKSLSSFLFVVLIHQFFQSLTLPSRPFEQRL